MDKNKVEPKTLPGFMELLPSDQIEFNSIKEKIQKSYEKFGFLPLDTPIIEASEVLLAKAGGETEKQIYRFNKGDNDLSLRFDLTVPLAKYVAANFGELSFPFRRYQIGKVYRGEKAQAGRFREFYQCDIDIIGDGSLSIMNDAEIPSVIYSTFKSLGFEDFTICINNRKILNGLFKSLDLEEKSGDILRVIDKIEKIGKENVIKELEDEGVEKAKIEKIISFIEIEGDTDGKIAELNKLGITEPVFVEGVSELEQVVKMIRTYKVPDKNFKVDLTIARGLDYYTGTVYETFLDNYKKLGSVCSGGRYENLAEYYTDKKLPGVGISIGLTRFFYQMKKENILKDEPKAISKILVATMSEENIEYAIGVAEAIRNAGINVETSLGDKKIKAKFKYADKLQIPYVAVIGEEEVNQNQISLKNMQTGEQETLSIDEVIEKIK
ncbi:MAG: histidine--tRNA ligase [Clostridia bacterium]|nr:histidine--tRNA ligase [Clostridia bacterium]MCI9274664.1 histidine--tRNA ligase [Clostridia bacterium]